MVIPLIDNGNDCDELRLSLRSLVKNFRDSFEVTIIGYKPKWITNVKYIPFSDSGDRECNTLNKAIFAANIYDEFIWWHDDFFLISPACRHDFSLPLYVERFNDIKTWGTGVFQKKLKKSFKILSEHFNEVYNFETHTPKLIRSSMFLKVVEKYDLHSKCLPFCTFYLNEQRPMVALLVNERKYGVYGSDSMFNENDAKGKMFLNFDEGARRSGVIEFLKTSFKNKTKFEKD